MWRERGEHDVQVFYGWAAGWLWGSPEAGTLESKVFGVDAAVSLGLAECGGMSRGQVGAGDRSELVRDGGEASEDNGQGSCGNGHHLPGQYGWSRS